MDIMSEFRCEPIVSEDMNNATDQGRVALHRPPHKGITRIAECSLTMRPARNEHVVQRNTGQVRMDLSICGTILCAILVSITYRSDTNSAAQH